MTKPATASEYSTMPVPTVVGGTLKLWTMPPMETGSDATLNDMIAWPSAIAIIGIHDSRTPAPVAAGALVVLIDCLLFRSSIREIVQASGLEASQSSGDARKESCESLSVGAIAGRMRRRMGVPSAKALARYGADSTGIDTNRSMPRRWDRNLATNCPLTLLPALSSGGANVPRPPLPGETVTIPPPIPLLPGSPIS